MSFVGFLSKSMSANEGTTCQNIEETLEKRSRDLSLDSINGCKEEEEENSSCQNIEETLDKRSRDLSLDSINGCKEEEEGNTSQSNHESILESAENVSIGSGFYDSLQSFESLKNVEEDEEDAKSSSKVIKKVTDNIIKAFTVQRRRALIDQADAEEDLVDYATSVRRLFNLAILLASILCLIGTTLTIMLFQHNRSAVTLTLSLNPKVPESSSPHLALLFNDGSMEIFEFQSNNTKLNHSWSFKIPKKKGSQQETFNDIQQYLGYSLTISSNNILIFYMGGSKPITVLSNSAGSNDLTHQAIPHSQVPRKLYYNSKWLHINHQVLLFGGMSQTVSKVPFNYYGFWSHQDYDVWLEYGKMSNKSLIWNLERQVYYPGPVLPDLSVAQGCPIALNRTHLMILSMDFDFKGDNIYTDIQLIGDNCLNGWLYSFEEYQWTYLDECFYLKESVAELRFNLMCQSSFGKDQNLRMLVAIEAFQRYQWTDTSLDLVLLEFDKKDFRATKINHNFCNGRAMSIFENQGRMFILATPSVGQTEWLYLYALLDEVVPSLVLLQNISVSFVASAYSNDVPPGGHDFIAVTGQFNRKQ